MTGTALILGGGVTGLHAALELEAAGYKSIVLEQGPILGGKRAAWLAGDGGLDPRLAAVGGNAAIEVLTLAELDSLTGEAGDFTASIRQRARFVNGDCTRCNHCVPVCPQAVANEYDAGLTFRKAIHSPLPQTIPDIYVIDVNSCLNVPPNYLPCQRCVEVCDDHAIDFTVPAQETFQRQIDTVIVATGFADDSSGSSSRLQEFGYGKHTDILSSVELQRLLEDPGPSGGFAIRPSNEAYPDSVLLILTDVSANGAWVMANHLQRLAQQDVEQLTLLVLAPPSDAEELSGLKETAASCGIELRWGSWIDVEASAGKDNDQQLLVRYLELPGGHSREQQVDLAVLSAEVHADISVSSLAQMLGLELDARGYLSASRPGIYVAGGAVGTVGIEAGAEQARQAVQSALQQLESEPPVADMAEPAGGWPDWSQLPQDRQRQYLEQMLQALLRLGEGSSR